MAARLVYADWARDSELEALLADLQTQRNTLADAALLARARGQRELGHAELSLLKDALAYRNKNAAADSKGPLSLTRLLKEGRAVPRLAAPGSGDAAVRGFAAAQSEEQAAAQQARREEMRAHASHREYYSMVADVRAREMEQVRWVRWGGRPG